MTPENQTIIDLANIKVYFDGPFESTFVEMRSPNYIQNFRPTFNDATLIYLSSTSYLRFKTFVSLYNTKYLMLKNDDRLDWTDPELIERLDEIKMNLERMILVKRHCDATYRQYFNIHTTDGDDNDI